MDQSTGGFMARHTSMPPRIQKTPYGDVSLTSLWRRHRYFLSAYGPEHAVRWMFPKGEGTFEEIGTKVRHIFEPAPAPITVERVLRQICDRWQDEWTAMYEDQIQGFTAAVVDDSDTSSITTLGQLFDHLHRERMSTVAPITTNRDRYKLKLWREELGEGTPLVSLTVPRLSAALKTIAKRVSPGTANASFRTVKTYLTWAANVGLIKNNSHKTVHSLKIAPGSKKAKVWWTLPEIELALRCAAEDEHQPTATLLVALGCYLGLRPAEIIYQRWQDLLLDAVDTVTGKPKPVCHVTAHDGWQPKTGEDRFIPIRSELLVILNKYRRSEGHLLMPEPERSGRRRGGAKGLNYRYNPHKVWARIMERIVAAGGKETCMAAMRHCFASNFLTASISDVKVARWLGHRDTRMVHHHYGHLQAYDDEINAGGTGAEKGP